MRNAMTSDAAKWPAASALFGLLAATTAAQAKNAQADPSGGQDSRGRERCGRGHQNGNNEDRRGREEGPCLVWYGAEADAGA